MSSGDYPCPEILQPEVRRELQKREQQKQQMVAYLRFLSQAGPSGGAIHPPATSKPGGSADTTAGRKAGREP